MTIYVYVLNNGRLLCLPNGRSVRPFYFNYLHGSVQLVAVWKIKLK